VHSGAVGRSSPEGIPRPDSSQPSLVAASNTLGSGNRLGGSLAHPARPVLCRDRGPDRDQAREVLQPPLARGVHGGQAAITAARSSTSGP
jgi:hypothetical protein